ncbi:MAG: family 20 glycosylhydrolase [Saprospiraceae bacterium]
MKPFILIISSLLLGSMLFFTSCKKEIPTGKLTDNLIPLPVKVTSGASFFYFKKETTILTEGENNDLKEIGKYLSEQLQPATGWDFPVQTKTEQDEGNYILLTLKTDKGLGAEGYDLTIDDEKITLSANEPAGLIRGIQSIIQLLPAAIRASEIQANQWKIQTGAVYDYPTYAHRGAMLDVSRHFFGVDEVKRYIDFLAAYKMNILHLHLADDQGWRIEIKSFPNLTTHGGSTEVGGGKGGFFTQEDYKEIVKYAAQRYITIIPEIDMPGHTNAALASYPELNCDEKAPELYTGIEVGFSSLCIDKAITYAFVDSVIRELSAITPGDYIHIGGDESHATEKKNYIQFVEKVQTIVNKYDKKMIGWADITAANLNNTSIAQYWNADKNAQKAVKQEMKVIMSPAKKAYLDMQYDSTSRIGFHWAAYIEVNSGYNWSLEKRVEGVGKEDILGIEAPLWTETVQTMDDIEYLVFPRLLGYAEIGWTSTEKRNWTDYKERLARFGKRFEAWDVDYYPSKLVDWEK